MEEGDEREEDRGAVGVESGGKKAGAAPERGHGVGDDPRSWEEGPAPESWGRRSLPALPPPAALCSQRMQEGAGCSEKQHMSRVAGRESKRGFHICTEHRLVLGTALCWALESQG